MKIEITRKEYHLLLTMIGLTQEILDIVEQDETRDRKYDDFFRRIYSLAKDFQSEDMVEYDKKEDTYCVSGEIADPVDLILEYDDEVFWHTLADRLSDRDLRRRYGEAGFEALDYEKMMSEKLPLSNRYTEEFETRGIDNIEIASASSSIRP
ncbi:MAG: hypothetical protein WCP86_00745 [bacterium]